MGDDIRNGTTLLSLRILYNVFVCVECMQEQLFGIKRSAAHFCGKLFTIHNNQSYIVCILIIIKGVMVDAALPFIKFALHIELHVVGFFYKKYGFHWEMSQFLIINESSWELKLVLITWKIRIIKAYIFHYTSTIHSLRTTPKLFIR